MESVMSNNAITSESENSIHVHHIDFSPMASSSSATKDADVRRLDLSPRAKVLSSVHIRIARYILNHTTASELVMSLRTTKKPGSRNGRRNTVVDLATDRREDVVEMFMHVMLGKSYATPTGDIELVHTKCTGERGLIAIRVDGETIASFNGQGTSCLFRCVGATALQKVVLELFFRLSGWSWAIVTFEAQRGIVVRNANNPKAQYPLAASLRVAVSEPMTRCLADVRRLQAEASKLHKVDLAGMAAVSRKLEFVEETLESSAVQVCAAPKTNKSRPHASARFPIDDESKQLRLTIERNILFPLKNQH
jgi:hypothetical protein